MATKKPKTGAQLYDEMFRKARAEERKWSKKKPLTESIIRDILKAEKISSVAFKPENKLWSVKIQRDESLHNYHLNEFDKYQITGYFMFCNSDNLVLCIMVK